MPKLLTVFTPTYNRAHTLGRTYESLCRQTCQDFEWLVIDDGSTDQTKELVEGFIAEGKIPVRYIYKENGGLYTGYNTAYAHIETELNVCIDSDDFMPDDAVEIIQREWTKRGSDKYCGLCGLDFDLKKKQPLGGWFPEGMSECYLPYFLSKSLHVGDSKQVMRTALMKEVAPQVGFEGEKNFNPYYMLAQVGDRLPILLVNENLCWVDYQDGDSMSAAIWKQYFNSPRSFAKLRRLNMSLQHNTFSYKVKSAIHYVSECLIARDKAWLSQSPQKLMTLVVSPLGLALYWYLLYRKHQASKA